MRLRAKSREACVPMTTLARVVPVKLNGRPQTVPGGLGCGWPVMPPRRLETTVLDVHDGWEGNNGFKQEN